MDSKENIDCGPDDLQLPAAKKICLDYNDVSNSFRDNSSLSDSTLHLGNLFSPIQSVSSCSINDGVDNSTFSSPIHGNTISDKNKSINEGKSNVFTFATSETDEKSDICIDIPDLNNSPEHVKIVENVKSNFSSNTSSLSIKAFNVDESLDFMDETCLESHSNDVSNGNLVSIEMESSLSLIEINSKNNPTTCVDDIANSINEDYSNVTKKSDGNCSKKFEVSLDYTCKPDANVMGEEMVVSSHSIIKRDATSPSCKLFLEQSLTSMSIDESLVSDLNNISCKHPQETSSDLLSKSPVLGGIDVEENDCEKTHDNSNSTHLLNEVSGCVLDYTCSKSVVFGVNESLSESISPNKGSEISINDTPECSIAEQQELNVSNTVIRECDLVDSVSLKNKNDLNLIENSTPDPENPTSDLYDLSDLKNSFISNKTFTTDEVNFLKENLLKVMELLKSDNNTFESYKLASENEKYKLLDKIKYLESNLSRIHESCSDILTSQEIGQEGKLDHPENYDFCEQVKKTHIQYNNLLQLVLITEADWTKNKILVNFLKDLNIDHNELFVPIKAGGNEFVINHKRVFDIMLSLSNEIAKSNSFIQECIEIFRSYKNSNIYQNRLDTVANECEEDLVDNLKATFREFLSNLNYLQKENADLKIETSNKSEKIKVLSSTIDNLNQQLNEVNESAVISINQTVKDPVMETTLNLSRVSDKFIIHDNLDDSNVNTTHLKESVTELSKALALSEENYNIVSLKCEKYEAEIQKMREMEQVYQELLSHNDVLKTEVNSKYCEIEKLNEENKKLIDHINVLKCEYETRCNFNVDLLYNEISELKMKCKSTEELLLDQEKKHSELKVSYDRICDDLKSQNSDYFKLLSIKEQLEKELETLSQNNCSLDQNTRDLKEHCDGLEVQALSTEEVSKLKSDYDCLNEKYAEILSNFDLYKQKYIFTEEESDLWKEEKQSLECELTSLKSQLEYVLEESSKLKSDKEEMINNLKNVEDQLCVAAQNSRDIQESYENLKTKYEESVVEINNNTKELQKLMDQLSDLEGTNANLKLQLSSVDSNSDNNVDLLQNEITELKMKCESTEKLLIDHEKKHNELMISHEKISESLKSKDLDHSELINTKEQLEKELETLLQNDMLSKQRIVELQEDQDGLKIQLLSSNEELSKMKLDYDCLNGKYSEILSNFDLYKQNYVFTEDESNLWKEEKQSLECELNSLRSKLESAIEESSKLKSDNEEFNNNLKNLEDQLCTAAQSTRDIQNSYDSLKTKYDESVEEVNNKITEIQNLLSQLTELETINGTLKNELSSLRSQSENNIEFINEEVLELRRKCEASDRLLIDNENKYGELKILYDKMCEDLESKNSELVSLSDRKDELEKELEMLNQNEESLKQKVAELQEDRDGLEIQFLSSKEEVSKLQLDYDCLNEKHSEMLSNFDLYKQKYIFTEDESNLWKEEKQSLECELNSLKSKLECTLEESSQLRTDNEEINNNLKNLEDQLYEVKESCKNIQNTYDSLKTKYDESVEEVNNKITEIQNLLSHLAELETINGTLKNELSCLRSQSENNIEFINEEVLELKRKCEASDRLLIDNENKYGELKILYDKMCEDLKSKNSDLVSLSDRKDELEKELEMLNQNEESLKQKVVELQEDRDGLEIQFLSSKEEVSKLQLDYDCLNEKHSEMLSNFDFYKQKYIFTEDESNLWKEEKQSLECELNSLRSKLECALEESSQLRTDNEEINNNLKNLKDQLYEVKEGNKDIQNTYDSLKTKYEESVIEINNKDVELKELLTRLSELETTNANLKTELTNFCNNADINVGLLNDEISELKLKCDSAEKLLIDHEKKHSELKISYDKICEDLESKNLYLSELTSMKEQLEKELDTLTQNDSSLKEQMRELKENCDGLEVQFLSSKEELSKMKLDYDCLNGKYSEMLSNFDLYKQNYVFTEDESNLWKEEKQSLECELNSLRSKLESAIEESSKLKSDNEEFNNNLKNLEDQLCTAAQSTRDIQNSYDSLKTKYDESVEEVNNKMIELQNLLAQFTELETINGNLKNELSSLRSDSENNIELINKEVLELKRKCETSDRLLIDNENKFCELKISYDKICEDLESKNSELVLLTDKKEKLEKELEMFNQNEASLKQKLVELQGDRDVLEIQFLSSKEEVSKMQLDIDSLTEKYSVIVSECVLYKEKYECTEDKFNLLREEKKCLECDMDSLKSKLECANQELQKLKSDNEENNNNLKNIENQLCDEKKMCAEIQSSFDDLKIKYEESVAIIDNKMCEIQNLVVQLSDSEANNKNLNSELNALRCDSEHKIDLLNKDIGILKEKCENFEKSLADLEEKHKELKVSYDHVCENYESKQTEFSLLTNYKEQLEKDIDTLSQNNLLLKQKLTEMEINEECQQKVISDLNIQLDSANSKIEYMKNIENQINVLKDEYDVLSSYCNKDKEICSEQPFCFFSEFVYAVEAVIKDLINFKAKCTEEVMKSSSSQEEVSRLNILLESLKDEIKLSAENYSKLQENYSSLSKQYNSLLDSSNDSNIRCNSLLEKLKELESQNNLHKSRIQDLTSELTAKESIIASLSNIKVLYESTVKENETLSTQLMEKIEEYETALCKLKNVEENYLSLKLEYNTLKKELNDLKSKNETLEMKCNENYALYTSGKDNIEVLLKEKDEIRKNFIKCEKDYQNSLDLVQKCQETMGNLDKQYNLSIAKLNAILKEKESYESQNLGLQKINDELTNRIKELSRECQENQNILMKLRELEKSYEIVTSKTQCLESQLVDYGNLKRENEVLKAHIGEKDSFTNNLSINYDSLKEKYNSLSGELKGLSTAVSALLPGETSTMEIIKVVGEKLLTLEKIENDLEEQKMKCQNLDEECNLLNEDLNYKDVVIGDMYKDHSSQMNELKELLKKEENLRQETLLENSTLKDKIKCLDSEILKLKTTEQSACSACVELKSGLQKLRMDLVDSSSKVTTLQLQIEENEITNKKKIHDYRKKISSLQEELGAALNKLEDNRLKNEVACINAFSQTESLPIQISGQSGIVQSFKIKEQEERIQRFEKENLVLKRMCQSRLQTIQELKTKLENVSKPQKTQRNVLEEVQNHQS